MLLHDYLDYWARRSADEICVTEGDRSITWGELRAWSNRVAGWLADELEPEARFGMLAKNSAEMFAIYFGASRAGVVPVPLNTRLAPPEWAFILDDAGSRLVVAETEFAEAIETIRDELGIPLFGIGPQRPGWGSFDAAVAARADQTPDRTVRPDAPLYQMYTSGTTGLPKGAVLTHAAVSTNLAQLHTAFSVYRTDAMIVMPLFHAGGAVGAFANVAGGTRSRLVRDFDPAEVLRILREEQIAVTTLVPAMIQMLLQEPDVRDHDYPHLRLIAYGASPIATEVLREAMTVFGCEFAQGYGMTELSATATMLDPEDHARALAGEPDLLLSAGRPLVGIDLRVVDANDSDVPVGDVGEVIIRGPQMMDGYWKRSAETAEAMRGGWMHTGDAGRLDDEGYLYLSDRIKDMIVSGGENVYPREIEEVLFTFDGIADAAVIGVPDERWGEVAKAVIVASPGVTLTEEAVVTYCRTRLAGFKCPRTVDFVETLPRNPTGKILKRELRAPYWRGYDRAVR